MAMKENFLNYTEVDSASVITVAQELISTAAFNTRKQDGYVYIDKGAGAIASGYDYDMYVNIPGFGIPGQLAVWMAANVTIGDVIDQRLAGATTDADFLLFSVDGAGVRNWQLHHIVGLNTTEKHSGTFSWAFSTNYRVNVTRSGQTITVKIYDEDAAGALRETLSVTASARAIVDMRYLYGFAGFNDGNVLNGSLNGATGPLWDNNASSLLQDDAAAIALLMETRQAN